jgi:hypothetical protein
VTVWTWANCCAWSLLGYLLRLEYWAIYLLRLEPFTHPVQAPQKAINRLYY